jgi:hypothetical protein
MRPAPPSRPNAGPSDAPAGAELAPAREAGASSAGHAPPVRSAMDFDAGHKVPVNVAELSIKVSGGTFHVSALMIQAHERQDDVISILHAVQPDRWFVMVSDNPEAETDSLAMIDDDLEFQIYAHGVLRQD